MSGDGSTPTVEEQIATLIAWIIANVKKFEALEAENVAIRATNGELRALIDRVTPDNTTLERPILIPNGEQVADRIAPITSGNPIRPDMNLDD